MLLSSSDSAVVSQTWAGFLQQLWGLGSGGTMGWLLTGESFRTQAPQERNIVLAKTLEFPPEETPPLPPAEFGVRDVGGGGRRGGRGGQKRGEEEKLSSREEGFLRETLGVMSEVTDGR